MWKVLGIIQKNLVWAVPTSMILGAIFGLLTDPSMLRGLILPLTFLMVYPMMVNLQIGQLLSTQTVKVQIMTQLINFMVIPFFSLGVGWLFYRDQPLIVLGLLLTSLLPTSGMTISWTGFARGNINAAIQMTVIGLILGSLATPFYAKVLMGAVVEIPLGEIFKQIILFVFLPMALGIFTKQALVKAVGKEGYQRDWKDKFPALSTVGVLGIVFVAIALKAEVIVSQPLRILSYFLPLIIIYSFNFMLSTSVGRALFNREDAIALVYGTVMRNLSIALAIAMTAFKNEGSEIALIISMAYIIQVQSAAWFVRFTDRMFGGPTLTSATSLPQK